MATQQQFKTICLQLEQATAEPHFEKISFRISKKIFATLDEASNRTVVKLSPADQYVYCTAAKDIITPVPGGWGAQGWTMIDLKKIKMALLKEVVLRAYCTVAPAKFAAKYQ